MRLFATASNLQIWIGIIGAALLFLTAPLLIKVYVGREFTTSITVLSFLSVSLFVKGAGYIPASILVALGRQRSRMQIQVGIAILNITLNLLFIPRWGLWAALGSTLICDAILVYAYTQVVSDILGKTEASRTSLRYAAVGVAFLVAASMAGAAPLISNLVAASTVLVVLIEFTAHRGGIRELLEEFAKANEPSTAITNPLPS
jgi:O-antigen/teichoic acid export membrane protein